MKTTRVSLDYLLTGRSMSTLKNCGSKFSDLDCTLLNCKGKLCDVNCTGGQCTTLLYI